MNSNISYYPREHPIYLIGISSTNHIITYAPTYNKLLIYSPTHFYHEWIKKKYKIPSLFEMDESLEKWESKSIKDLVGKHAIRVKPCEHDYSFIEEAIYIVGLDENRFIFNRNNSVPCTEEFDMKWNDGNWVEVPEWVYEGQNEYPIK